jgi:hypothetical protein
MLGSTLAPSDATNSVESAQALIEEARRRHRRRRWWTATAVVLVVACIGLVIEGTSGTGKSGGSYDVGRHRPARSSWCTSGLLSAAPGGSAISPGTLPATDGLCGGLAVRGLTLLSWGGGGGPDVLRMGVKDGGAPFTPAQLGLKGSLSQFWVLTAAFQSYGAKNLQLPIPSSFVKTRPGPAEVAVTVLSFDNGRSPQRLLGSTFYNHLGWPGTTQIHSPSDENWMVTRINSLSNGGMGEVLLQGSVGSRWIQVAVIGFDLTLDEARGIATATTG